MRVGATGHRADRLGTAGAAAVAKAAPSILAMLDRASGSRQDAPNRLVTCAADGADSLLADAALAAGWRLDLILPFPRVDCRRDFTPPADADFDRQLASADQVIELPGRHDEPDGRAYARAGSAMLDRCDLLVGVWDGGPGRGPGGTVEVIAEGSARGIPVILVDPAEVWPAGFALPNTAIDDVPRQGLERLPDVIAAILARRRTMGAAA